MADNNRRRTRQSYYTSQFDDMKYGIRYGVDANAALKPEYYEIRGNAVPKPAAPIPAEPRRRTVTRHHNVPAVVPKSKKKPQIDIARLGFVMCVLFTVALACVVVFRNSQIYGNNREIQALSVQVTEATYNYNMSCEELSAMQDINQCINVAQQELGMVYNNEIETVSVTPTAENINTAATNAIVHNDSIIDSILDWMNSLDRRP